MVEREEGKEKSKKNLLQPIQSKDRTYANKPRNRVSDLDKTAQIRIFRRETRFLRKS